VEDVEEQDSPEAGAQIVPPDALMEELAAAPQAEEPPAAPGPSRRRPVVTAVVASAAVLVFALAFFMAGFVAHAYLDDDDGGTGGETSVSLSDDPAWGPEDAEVTIQAFTDFQCPFCKKFAEETLPRLRATYGDRVRFIFRDLPLTGVHPVAALAAQAGGCANDQGKFWEYHDILFANQASLSDATLTQYASQAGLDVSQFNECLSSQQKMADVLLDMQDAQRQGVNSTPAFVINGVLVSGAQPYELFAAVIDQSLAAQ
jgi:protein-disulfide isomerase